MSDLEDLEDLAGLWGYRNHAIFSGPRTVAKKPASEICLNGHVRTEKNTRWAPRTNCVSRKPQRVCLDCRRASEQRRPARAR